MANAAREWGVNQFSEEGIEEYLQPYPRRDLRTRELYEQSIEAGHLKDGLIMRALHGGMHVGRASLLIFVLNHLFKQCFPVYTETSRKAVCEALKIDQKLLTDLNRGSLIYHDQARKNEGYDYWDKESAEKLNAALRAWGFSGEIASFFESATANKDKPKTFDEYCEKNLPQLPSENRDYLRKLINLADCFDSIRVRGEFDFRFVILQISDIPSYNQEQHLPRFIEFGQNLHTVIWDQGDMYFDCKLVLDGQVFPTERTGAHFVRARKVQFEHAPHVVSALAAHMMTYPYFKLMLENEAFLSADLATVEAGFDPFIHGTQSGALTIIKLMRDRGLSPDFNSARNLVEMFLAPVTGELSRRGANKKLTDSAFMCFGRLQFDPEDRSQYDIDAVLSYAKKDAGELDLDLLKENTVKYFKYYLDQCYKCGFTYINALMIYYLRAKQFGVDDKELLPQEDKDVLLKYYRHNISVYYLILLVDKHLRLNKAFIDSLRYGKDEFARKVADKITLNVLLVRLSELDIDVKTIYENPTESNLEKLLPLFVLDEAEENWLTITFDKPQHCELDPYYDSDYDFMMLSQNHRGWGVDHMLQNYIDHYPSNRPVVRIQKYVPEHIKNLEETLVVLEGVLGSESENLLEDPICCKLIGKNFPIILVSEADEAINIANFGLQEYRADRALVFGQDIKMIATDTREHAALLRKFLDQNGFRSIGVILFSTLKSAKDSSCRPKQLYHVEKSSLPTLSWLAAKSVVPGVQQDRKGESLYTTLERRFELAEVKYKAVSEKNSREEKKEITKGYRKARADFRRVQQYCDFLEDADTYHKAFNKN